MVSRRKVGVLAKECEELFVGGRESQDCWGGGGIVVEGPFI